MKSFSPCNLSYFKSSITYDATSITLWIINVHSRSNRHGFNDSCHWLISQLSHRNFPKISHFTTTTTTTTIPFNGPCPGLPGWAGTRKVKPIWILLKQETVSGSGISWAVCKSAHGSRQITTPASHHSVFTGRMPFLPPNQQRQSTEGQSL